MSPRLAIAALVTAATLAAAAPASAQYTGFERSGFGSAPVGSLGGLTAPLSGFDRTRLSVSTSITVGGGYGGYGGTQGLQVTRLGYQFSMPLSLSVGIGSRFGGPGQTNPFLESVSLRYQGKSAVFRLDFHDVRSPLQLTREGDPFGRDAWWGY